MPTLADLKESTTRKVSTLVNGNTPVGHFTATVKVNGVHYTTYLMEGVKDEDNALIKGRVEDRGPGEAIRVYRDGALKSTSWTKMTDTVKDTFASMV